MMRDSKKKIFIVEDDPFYQEIIKYKLIEQGHSEIEIYSNGEDCINNLDQMPDIILLDYYLENSQNGIEVLKSIKTVSSKIQIIMLSSCKNMEVAAQALKLGAYNYVLKNDLFGERIDTLIKRIASSNYVEL